MGNGKIPLVVNARLMDRLHEKARKRNKDFRLRMRTQELDFRSFPDRTILGGFTWTQTTERIRHMWRRDALHLFDDIPQTPTEVARDYLAIAFSGSRARVDAATYQQIMRHRSAPRFANPGELGECAYIDLEKAYFSILNIVGWNVSYHPGKWIGAGYSVQDFPLPDVSISRNSLVSTCIADKRSEWDGQKVVIQQFYNPMMNYALWSIVMDILNGVASNMLYLFPESVHYWHTDGFIIDANRVDDAIGTIWDRWGLVARVKDTGKTGMVWNSNEYRVGYHRTLTNSGRKRIHDGIDKEVDFNWLSWRVKKLATLRASGYMPERPQD